MLFIGILAGVALISGFFFGSMQSVQTTRNADLEEAFQSIAQEKAQLLALKDDIESETNALALSIGSLRAHMLRLDALGERLVSVGKLDAGEFDFSSEPAQGGVDGDTADSLPVSALGNEMDRLTALMEDREHKLTLLEDLLARRELREQVVPSGRPVKHGYISSTYGRRVDPFTGKAKYHKGIDFAAKKGSEVLSVAAGMVVKSERMSGYGNVVEVRHADGYVTRYAHNQENLVEVGDQVEKGETIAVLGSTGHSTGPHVHFEVRRNGKLVNPSRLIKKG